MRSDIRAIASLTCMVLRRGLPPVPLPLSTLDNPISFPLPEVTGQNQSQRKEVRSVSESSSAQTTSSDLSSQRKEGVLVKGVPVSMASTSLVPFLSFRVREDLGRNRDSDSDSNTNANNHCSDAGDLHASIHILGTSCSSVRAVPNGRALASGEVDSKARTDLEQFANYFPELDETKNCWFLSRFSNSSHSNPSKWDELEGVSSYDSDSIQEVAIPTAAECSGSSTEYLSDSSIVISSKKAIAKSILQFVEEPLPQVLGPHQPPPHDEPVYSKLNSVDR